MQAVTLSDALRGEGPGDIDLELLDECLTALEQQDQHQGRIVELRYFAGLAIEETAETLKISPVTVKREWAIARAWLHRRMRNSAGLAAEEARQRRPRLRRTAAKSASAEAATGSVAGSGTSSPGN